MTTPTRSTRAVLAELELELAEEARALHDGQWDRLGAIAERKAQLLAEIETPVLPEHRPALERLLWWGSAHASVMQEVLASIEQPGPELTYDARARRSDRARGGRGVFG